MALFKWVLESYAAILLNMKRQFVRDNISDQINNVLGIYVAYSGTFECRLHTR